jgi:ABC-2 type transport system permease protein
VTAQSEATRPAQAASPSLSDIPLGSPFASGGLVEVLQRRYLLRLLVQKQLQARYQGSFLGLFWSYVQPLVRFAMYFFVIGLVLGLHKDFPNYAIHMFAAIVGVHFFTESFQLGTRSIVQNKSLVRKMAMPRELFPVAAVAVAMVDSFPQLVILFIGSVVSGWKPDPVGLLSGLLGVLIVMVLGTALALLFAGFNVFFRDFQNIVSTFTIFTHWIVPMIYPFERLATALSDHPVIYGLYMSNPLTTAVILLQRCFWIPTCLGQTVSGTKFPDNAGDVGFPFLPQHYLALGFIMLAFSLALLGICQLVFRRVEGRFAERL